MNVCVFCGEAVVPTPEDGDVVWATADGGRSCTSAGGTGPHYPGREADLFWRGSEVIDLRAEEPVVQVADGARRATS